MSNETRKLPTRPGWWWGREFLGGRRGLGDLKPCLLAIREDDGALMVEGPLHLDNPDFYEWLAPIPGPEVLAALAEWSAADADWNEFETTACGWRRDDADLALRAAIRAERDGDA